MYVESSVDFSGAECECRPLGGPSEGSVRAAADAAPSSSAPAMSAAPSTSAECTLDKEGLSMEDKAAYFDRMTQQVSCLVYVMFL